MRTMKLSIIAMARKMKLEEYEAMMANMMVMSGLKDRTQLSRVDSLANCKNLSGSV